MFCLPCYGLSHKIQNHARFSIYHHHIICISIANFTYNCKSFTTFYALHWIFYFKVFWLSGTGKIFVNYSRIAQYSEASACLNSPGLPHVKIYCKVWSEVVAGIFNSHSIQWEWMNKREIWVTYCVILESFENSELNLPRRKRRTNM